MFRQSLASCSRHVRSATALATKPQVQNRASLRSLLCRRAMAHATAAADRSNTSHEHPHQQRAKEQHATGPNEWKSRPPYRINNAKEQFDARWSASCHCGRVEYQLSRESPLDSKLCHCGTCQTQHAAPFQWAAIFHKTDIQFKRGHHDLEWYDPTSKSVEHCLPCKVRCAHCHSPIMDEGRNMILLFPSLVHFKNKEERELFRPKCHLFYGQRVMDILDGLPKWSGLNNASDLIEDSPPELVKEQTRRKEHKRKREDQEGIASEG